MHIIINRINYNKNEIRAIHPCQHYQNLRNTKKLKCTSINKRHKPTSILKTYTDWHPWAKISIVSNHKAPNIKQNKRKQRNSDQSNYPRMVRQRILEGARKWIGPWEGLVFMRLRRNLWYFIFWRTRPPERHNSSHLTTTTFLPLNNSLANMEANLPRLWCLASTTTLSTQIPDPETIFFFFFSSSSSSPSRFSKP